MTADNELKKQAAKAKQAAKIKPKKQMTKWQTGKNTYRLVTVAQAKAWSVARSNAKTKMYREARKEQQRIKKELAAEKNALSRQIKKVEKDIKKMELQQEGWIIEWEDLPDALKGEEYRVGDSESWLVLRLFAEDGHAGDASPDSGRHKDGALDVRKLFISASNEIFDTGDLEGSGEVSDKEALKIIFEAEPQKAKDFFGYYAQGTTGTIDKRLESWLKKSKDEREQIAKDKGFSAIADPDEEQEFYAGLSKLDDELQKLKQKKAVTMQEQKLAKKADEIIAKFRKGQWSRKKANEELHELEPGVYSSETIRPRDMFGF